MKIINFTRQKALRMLNNILKTLNNNLLMFLPYLNNSKEKYSIYRYVCVCIQFNFFF